MKFYFITLLGFMTLGNGSENNINELEKSIDIGVLMNTTVIAKNLSGNN